MNDHEDPTPFESADHAEVAARLRQLPAEVPPARDLWPAIAARTVGGERAKPRRFLRGRTLALAAGVALALLGGWLVARPRPTAGPETAMAPESGAAFVAPAAYRETDAALSAVRDSLRREVEARGDSLPPELARLVAENLATIDRAIAEIEAALAAEPGNGDLARAWVDYRQREISLLRRVNQAAAQL